MTYDVELHWCCEEPQADGERCEFQNSWPTAKRSLGISVCDDAGRGLSWVEEMLRDALNNSVYCTDQHGIRHLANLNGVVFRVHRVAVADTLSLDDSPWYIAVYAGDVQPDLFIESQPLYEEPEMATA